MKKSSVSFQAQAKWLNAFICDAIWKALTVFIWQAFVLRTKYIYFSSFLFFFSPIWKKRTHTKWASFVWRLYAIQISTGKRRIFKEMRGEESKTRNIICYFVNAYLVACNGKYVGLRMSELLNGKVKRKGWDPMKQNTKNGNRRFSELRSSEGYRCVEPWKWFPSPPLPFVPHKPISFIILYHLQMNFHI